MRLRQVATVARDLDRVVEDFCRVMEVEVAYRDPGVAEFGPDGDPFHELHDKVVVAGDFTEVDPGDNVLVVEAGDGARFPGEPFHEGRILGEARRENLDRDIPVDRRLMRAIDRAHPTNANRLLDSELLEQKRAEQRIGELVVRG